MKYIGHLAQNFSIFHLFFYCSVIHSVCPLFYSHINLISNNPSLFYSSLLTTYTWSRLPLLMSTGMVCQKGVGGIFQNLVLQGVYLFYQSSKKQWEFLKKRQSPKNRLVPYGWADHHHKKIREDPTHHSHV